MFTVIEVLRILGVEPEAPTTWAVGAAVRDRFRETEGDLPVKRLTRKTSGAHGSHWLAWYPESFRPAAMAEAARVLATATAVQRRQPGLFEYVDHSADWRQEGGP